MLKEQRRRRINLPSGDALLPLFIVAILALLWIWRPWRTAEPQAAAAPSATPTATPTPHPSATYFVAPTATPLHSPTPEPTATLPPDTTRHQVEAGETVSTIAKLYGTTSQAILEANGLRTNSLLSVGQELIIPLPVANTATPTPTLTPSPTPFVYTIKSGETLSSIAKRFNTTVETLMEFNGISDATRIQSGTEITIVQPPDYTATMAYAVHLVQAGDTLYTLSAKYGLTIAELKEINNLTSDTLRVDQELRIPVGTATPAPTSTPTPTLTPIPGPPWPAPALLAPPDGTAFEGAETTILLTWASVGILEDDEWYVVRMRRSGVVTEQLPLVWTKATSWRIPAELYVPGLEVPQRFTWQVTVMRMTGEDDAGTWRGDLISTTGIVRTFTWK